MGPQDLWWLLREASAAGRQSILGTHGWSLDQGKLDRFIGAPDDPVSEAAGRSVAQLIDSFPAKGLVDAIAATVYARILVMFFLGDSTAYDAQIDLLYKRCSDDSAMTCLTAVVFAALAAQLWTDTTGGTPEFWAATMSDTGIIDLEIARLVLAAIQDQATEGIPDDPYEQQHIAVELCMAITITLQYTADLRHETVITVLQDLLIAVQRMRAAPPDEEWLAAHRRPRSLDF
jgi:hypothetical protein